MATFGNREILIKIDELPKINGMRIDRIYLEYYDKRGVKDYTVRPEDRIPYYTLYPYFHSVNREKYPIIRTKKLPKQFSDIFDNVIEATYPNGYHKSIKPTSMWYRTSDSGSGGFIDDSISIDGASNNNTGSSISFTRNSKYPDDLPADAPAAKLMLNTLNINETVEVMPEYEYTYYPCTTLRRVDNWYYPTTVCSGWRWLYGMPYVTLDKGESLRVLNVDLKCHVFLNKVKPEDIEIGREYKIVTFPSYSDKEPDRYCHIRSWSDSKQDDPNGMVSFRVDKIYKSKAYNNEMVCDCTVVGQTVRGAKIEKGKSINQFYTIARIINTDDLND